MNNEMITKIEIDNQQKLPWKIIDEASNNERKYLNAKLQQIPDIFKHWNSKNKKAVSKRLSEEAYKRDNEDLKRKETKVCKLVWEKATSNNGLHVYHKNSLNNVYDDYKKKHTGKDLSNYLDDMWNDLSFGLKAILQSRSLCTARFVSHFLIAISATIKNARRCLWLSERFFLYSSYTTCPCVFSCIRHIHDSINSCEIREAHRWR